jgi:hypothetical protein
MLGFADAAAFAESSGPHCIGRRHYAALFETAPELSAGMAIWSSPAMSTTPTRCGP